MDERELLARLVTVASEIRFYALVFFIAALIAAAVLFLNVFANSGN